jgi:hypothetical protein
MSTGAQEGMDRTCSMNAAKSLEMAACRAPSSLKRLRALLLILPAARAAPTDHRYRPKPNQGDIRIRIVLQHTSLHGLDAAVGAWLRRLANGTAAMPCHAMRTVECTASAHRIT